ncbi:MAG: ABC transporter permease [Candidatus Aenigmatarchaeota archaeon]|nr:ABC transporter permease [Candidatus Aenigmarchaeota archaeon]
MIKEYIQFAFSTIVHQRKRRSFLTILGIFIGIAAVVALISVSQGLKDAVSSQFELIGADVITIMPGKFGAGGMTGFGARPLTDTDVEIVENIRGVGTVAPILVRTAKVTFSGEEKYTYVMGIPADKAEDVLLSMEGIKVIEGRLTTKSDKYGAIIGYSIADDFFEKDVHVGDKLEISGKEFKVRGRISKIGNRQDDSQIYIHMSTAREIFNTSEISVIILKVEQGADVERVAEKIKEELKDKHGEEDFSVMTSSQLASIVQNILGIIQLVIVGIAGISLLVGGVGIMNTMYTSVQERTRQIGIMKAVGATNSDILTIFLVESGLLGLVGGVIGCVIGIVLAFGVQFGAEILGYSMLKASVPLWLIAFALGFSFVLGMLSGTLPARHAARMNPVDALRYE